MQNSLIDGQKAWTEMFHRYMAGSLGVIIFLLWLTAITSKDLKQKPFFTLHLLLITVIFQAVLGMWTVTHKLYPIVVMAHLLGGFLTLSLLWYFNLQMNRQAFALPRFNRPKFIIPLYYTAFVLLILQIFLGGWTSANYAALVCFDFPSCQAGHSVQYDFKQAFNLINAGVTGSFGNRLSLNALMTIHMVHRINAILTSLSILILIGAGFFQIRDKGIRLTSSVILILLTSQIALGILNVIAKLPLMVALLHNGLAALLLLALLSFYHYIWPFLHPSSINEPV